MLAEIPLAGKGKGLKMSSSTNPATVDLDGEISQEEYREVITRVFEYMITLANRKSWCSERHNYFSAIMPEYIAGNSTPSWDMTPDQPYAESLRQLRGKVLYYARSEVITPDIANEAFRASGLPEYPVKTGPTRYYAYLPRLYFTSTYEFQEGHSAVLIRAIIELLNGRPDPSGLFVPASVHFNGISGEVYRVHSSEGILIAESDTVRPSYQ